MLNSHQYNKKDVCLLVVTNHENSGEGVGKNRNESSYDELRRTKHSRDVMKEKGKKSM